ncbi:MAG: D-alanyl-D-alanine carboxypeptidase/D-alanyl-D-alanine-endopeptidase [Pseudomonadota bacterium]
MLRPLLITALLACGAARAQLPEPVARLLEAAAIPQEAVGAVVLRGNEVMLSHGAERSMHPASTIKLVTTLVALEQLGPAFRGRTELRSNAELNAGVLQGDLVLRGGADPDFNAEVLEQMLQTLRQQGVDTIGGDLIVDRQLFQPARPDLGQPPFDEYPEARYNVIPDALLLNTNLLHIALQAGDRRLTPLMLPALDGVSVTADMRLSQTTCASWEDGWRRPDYVREGDKLKVVLHGTFPRNCIQSTSVNVLDRQDYLARLFRATWRRVGGTFRGAVREAAGPPDSRLLGEHMARALPEVVRDINKNSDNTLARLLYLSLGSLEADSQLGSRPQAPVEGAPAATAARAESAVRGWFARHQLDHQGLVLENGSGLSRTERIRPDQMAALLQAAGRSVWAPEFLSSLPIAALDGTMRRRLRDSPAAARARIKTGSLKGVVAVAGFVPDAHNQPCVVVAMINHEQVANGAGRAALDALIDWVATLGQPVPVSVPVSVSVPAPVPVPVPAPAATPALIGAPG